VTIFNYNGALLNFRNLGATSLPVRTTLAGKQPFDNLSKRSKQYLKIHFKGCAEITGATIGMCLLLKPKFKFAILSFLMLVGGSSCISSWALVPDGMYWLMFFILKITFSFSC
jgi:hypothetical protein